jgi:hypothetical protein
MIIEIIVLCLGIIGVVWMMCRVCDDSADDEL